MSRPRLDPRWVSVGYMDQYGTAHLMDILERDLPWALANGWSLYLRYRDDPPVPPTIDPSQSNPNRTGDPEC